MTMACSVFLFSLLVCGSLRTESLSVLPPYWRKGDPHYIVTSDTGLDEQHGGSAVGQVASSKLRGEKHCAKLEDESSLTRRRGFKKYYGMAVVIVQVFDSLFIFLCLL